MLKRRSVYLMLMKHYALWILKTVVVIVLLLLISVTAAEEQPSPVVITLPIHGYLVLPVGDRLAQKLVSIDTNTGIIQTLVESQGAVNSPIWDSTGEKIAYSSNQLGSAIINFAANTVVPLKAFEGQNPDEVFYPAGWSADDSDIMYNAIVPSFPSSKVAIYLLDVNSNTLNTLLTRQTPILTTTVPPPSEISSLILYYINQVKRNPVYDQWVILQVDAVDSTTVDDPNNPPANMPGNFIYVNVLWNYVTDQMISLDNLLPEHITELPISWSPNGNSILVNTKGEDGNKPQIIHFSSVGEFDDVESASSKSIAEFWLGAGDLLLARSKDKITNDLVYYIAEIVDGIWHETEFFRLEGEDFNLFKPGDWHITASDEEKQVLACLFDHALDGGTCDA